MLLDYYPQGTTLRDIEAFEHDLDDRVDDAASDLAYELEASGRSECTSEDAERALAKHGVKDDGSILYADALKDTVRMTQAQLDELSRPLPGEAWDEAYEVACELRDELMPTEKVATERDVIARLTERQVLSSDPGFEDAVAWAVNWINGQLYETDVVEHEAEAA